MKSIDKFQGETRWLSNFWFLESTFLDKDIFQVIGTAFDQSTKLIFEKYRYPTTEHAYQAMKIGDARERKEFIDKHNYLNLTPGEVKKLSRKMKMRPDWDEVKLDVMYQLQKFKFSEANPKLRAQLVGTTLWGVSKHAAVTQKALDDPNNFAYLTEGNTWGDKFWGCSPDGENHLGKIIMEVRNDIIMSLDRWGTMEYPEWQDWYYGPAKPVMEV